MKKSLILCFAVVCCILTSVVFTSCSDDDDSSDYVVYTLSNEVNGSLGKVMLNALICEKMQDAISASFGGAPVYARDDAKAIKACDKVAEEYRNADAGTIELCVSTQSSDPNDNTTTTVKTYTFPF